MLFRSLAKSSNVPLRNLKKGARVKLDISRQRKNTTARLWYGLNAIPAKHLGYRKQKKGIRVRGVTYPNSFVVKSLGEHVFQREGRKIKKIEFAISEKGLEFLEKFEPQVNRAFLGFFFEEIDNIQGRRKGDSAGIAMALKA